MITRNAYDNLRLINYYNSFTINQVEAYKVLKVGIYHNIDYGSEDVIDNTEIQNFLNGLGGEKCK